MANISKITLPSGVTYDIKDAVARSALEGLGSAMHFLGVTTTAITDGSTSNPITIAGENATATAGDVIIYGDKEFIFSGDDKWHELGDMGSLRALAFKDSAEGSYTPTGTVSQPTFSGGAVTASGSFTPEGEISVTPTVTLNTTTVNSITDVGTLPSITTAAAWTGTVTDETLAITWTAEVFNPGTLPTKGTDTTVATGVQSATASGSFTGTAKDVSVTGTATGTVSQPTFTGTNATITVS